MRHSYNLAEIEERYRFFYQEAIRNGTQTLPLYDVQHWDQVLNEVEHRVFDDIRLIGIALFPIFPVAAGTYLHFANPFLRVGIEIVYKKTPKELLNRKALLLKPQNWKIYTIISTNCYHTIDEFFRIKRTKIDIEFEDLTPDLRLLFFEKYYQENAGCLLYYIKCFHFAKEYA